MKTTASRTATLSALLAALLLVAWPGPAPAAIDGLQGTDFGNSFTLVARADYLSTGDGNSVYFWGFADESGPASRYRAQYPGPTLILRQYDTITITLKNRLPVPVSLVFPGQRVTATGGAPGLLTQEVPAYNPAVLPEPSVTYTFTASRPGTFMYHSGTQPELQVEMGLLGAIVVRPANFDPAAPTAYGNAGSAYGHEHLFILTEMDPRIHRVVELQGIAALAATDYLADYFANYWFMNGRTAPDTMQGAGVGWLPTQPYNCLPIVHMGDRMLMRVVTAGRELHPFHHHGNHARIIARDGRPLETTPGAFDLSYEVFTIQAVPGETVDALFEWTGAKMGWDIFGTEAQYEHSCNGISVSAGGDVTSAGFDAVSGEYCPDHGKAFPVVLPEQQGGTLGGFWSGSPFMGATGAVPPGEGGLNPWGGFTFMWHSHTEKELTNFNIFPGGMLTMVFILPRSAVIP